VESPTTKKKKKKKIYVVQYNCRKISRTSEKKMERLNPWLKQVESPTTKKKKKKKIYVVHKYSSASDKAKIYRWKQNKK